MANFSKNETERDRILRLLQDVGQMTSTQVGQALNIPRSKARYYLDVMRKDGLVVSKGRGSNGGYAPVRMPRRNGVRTEQEILDVLTASSPDALTTAEIAAEIGAAPGGIKAKLHQLQTRGVVTGERAGQFRGYRLAEQTDVTDYGTERLDEFIDGLGAAPETEAVDDANATEYTEERRNEKVMDLLRDAGDVLNPAQISTILGHQVSGVEDAGTVPGIGVITSAETTPTRTTNPVTVPIELLDRVKDLPFSVGVAAMALLENDVPTAKRMLEIS